MRKLIQLHRASNNIKRIKHPYKSFTQQIKTTKQRQQQQQQPQNHSKLVQKRKDQTKQHKWSK